MLPFSERHRQYVNPGEMKVTIRKAVQGAIRDSPRVLIHIASGRLYNKSEQAAAFESFPLFAKLISSMTAHRERRDRCRIACLSTQSRLGYEVV